MKSNWIFYWKFYFCGFFFQGYHIILSIQCWTGNSNINITCICFRFYTFCYWQRNLHKKRHFHQFNGNLILQLRLPPSQFNLKKGWHLVILDGVHDPKSSILTSDFRSQLIFIKMFCLLIDLQTSWKSVKQESQEIVD